MYHLLSLLAKKGMETFLKRWQFLHVFLLEMYWNKWIVKHLKSHKEKKNESVIFKMNQTKKFPVWEGQQRTHLNKNVLFFN